MKTFYHDQLEMRPAEITQFLISGAVDGRVSASTQNQALAALLVQELLGHQDVVTTMIYTHVLNRGGRGAKNPAERVRLAETS